MAYRPLAERRERATVFPVVATSVSSVPVVATAKGVTLADHLDLRNLPLSTTPAGKAFAIKSLHPSDHEIKAPRLPGRSFPSVGLACDIVETIPVPATAVSANYIQTANPAVPGALIFRDVSQSIVQTVVFFNSAFGLAGSIVNPSNANFEAEMNKWHSSSQDIISYCITAQSVTCEAIVPPLYESGSVISAQYRDKPKSLSSYAWSKDANDYVIGFGNMTDYWVWCTPPSKEVLMMGTSAYTGKLRDGFYQPLKLQEFKWRAASDPMIFNSIGPLSMDKIEVANVGFQLAYPYGLNSVNKFNSGGYAMPKPTSFSTGMTFIDGLDPNLAPSISLRFRIRQCIDIVPRMGGKYAPLAEAPLPPDELSYKMVREIAGKMKDAYPASYNDLGKLKEIIGSIGRGILKVADPALAILSNFVPGINAAGIPIKMLASMMANASPIARGDGVVKPLPLPPLGTQAKAAPVAVKLQAQPPSAAAAAPARRRSSRRRLNIVRAPQKGDTLQLRDGSLVKIV